MGLRYFFSESIPAAGNICKLDSEEAWHAGRVFRARKDTRLGLLDGKGTRAVAEVVDTTVRKRRDSSVNCRVVEQERFQSPSAPLHLFVGLPRGKQTDEIVRQATEMGVQKITPLLCERSVAKPYLDQKREHWQNRMKEALKQSANPFLPELSPATELPTAVAHDPKNGIFGECSSDRQEAPDIPELKTDRTISLWVGPEGGFTEAEKQALLDNAIQPLQTSQWVLRVDTAVIALLGWVFGQTDALAVRCPRL